MYNIFKSCLRTLFAVLLAFVLFTVTSFHVSAKQHYSRAYHAPTVKATSHVIIVSFDAMTNLVLNTLIILPPPTLLPAPVFTGNLFPKNEAKPDNLNYQPIRQRSLGLINSQLNI